MKNLLLISLCFVICACADSKQEVLDMPMPEALVSQPEHPDHQEIIGIRNRQALSYIDCLRLASSYARHDQDTSLVKTWLNRAMDLDSQAALRSINGLISSNRALSKSKYASVVRSALYR